MQKYRTMRGLKKVGSDSIDEADLFRLIQRRYDSSEYLVMKHVRSAPDNKARIADAIAIGLWKSRDICVHGFEVKTSRASWLSELADPAKAEEVAKFCHYWWIVAPNETIVDPVELPKNWGLQVIGANFLKVLVEAPTLLPKPMDHEFIACLLRQAIDQNVVKSAADIDEKAHQAGYLKGFEQGEKKSNQDTNNAIDSLTRRLHEKSRLIEEFEGMLGLKISHLDFKSVKAIGEIIRVYKLNDKRETADHRKITDLLDAYYFLSDKPIASVIEKLEKIKWKVSDVNDFLEKKLNDIREFKEPYEPGRLDKPDAGKLPE